jgi:hypothetical protein
MLLMMLALAAGPARAQWPAHRLAAVFPPGGEAGTTVEVTLTGTDLTAGTRLHFGHPGVRAEPVKDQTYRVTIAPDATAGHYEAHVFGPLGVSNPRAFVVGIRDEAAEAEPNNDATKSGPLAPGATVNGRLDPATDRDHFAFDGKAGERVVLELEARRIDSRLEPMLRLLDAKGVELEGIDHGLDGDPCLEFVLPADGRYVVALQDVTYGGSPEHVYRLSRHAGPVLDAVRPAVVPGEEPGPLELLGRGLGGTALDGAKVGGQPVESVATAALAAPLVHPAGGFVPAGRAGRGVRVVGAPGGSGMAGRRLVATATEPVVPEATPNDESHPQVIVPPVEVAGAFERPGDADAFDFAATKGDAWQIEVQSGPLGSPADPTLVVQRLSPTGEPADLAAADDEATPPGLPIPLASVDAALRWVAPETGRYRLLVADRYGTERGDVRFAYRLRVRPARPGFRLYVLPGPLQPAPAGINIRPGGRTTVRAVVERRDGFDGTVRVEGFDPGRQGPVIETSYIGPGQTSAEVVVEHPEGTFPPLGEVTLRGRSVAGDRKEILNHIAGAARASEQSVFSIPLTPVRAPQGNDSGPLRQVAALRVGVASSMAPFRLDVRPGLVHARPEETVTLEAVVTRRKDFAEAVEVATGELPPNVPAAKATIAKDAPAVAVELKLPKGLAPGVYTVVLRGTASVSFQRTPDAKPETVKATEPANPVTLVIHK